HVAPPSAARAVEPTRCARSVPLAEPDTNDSWRRRRRVNGPGLSATTSPSACADSGATIRRSVAGGASEHRTSSLSMVESDGSERTRYQLAEQDVRSEIERAFPELAVREVAFLGAGVDSAAYLVNDAWVFRFPKRAEVARALRREIALLPKLADQLPVAIPRFR